MVTMMQFQIANKFMLKFLVSNTSIVLRSIEAQQINLEFFFCKCAKKPNLNRNWLESRSNGTVEIQ